MSEDKQDFQIDDLNKRVNNIESKLELMAPQLEEVASFVVDAKKFLRHTKAIIAGIAGLNVANWSGLDPAAVASFLSMIAQSLGG